LSTYGRFPLAWVAVLVEKLSSLHLHQLARLFILDCVDLEMRFVAYDVSSIDWDGNEDLVEEDTDIVLGDTALLRQEKVLSGLYR